MMSRWHSKKQTDNTEGQPDLSKSSHAVGGEILDADGAIKRLGGRRQLFAGIIEKFRPEHETAHKDIAQQLAAGDRKTATRTAHTVKGAAAAIGANQLSHISAKLESAIVDHLEEIDGLLIALEEKLFEAFTAIDAFLEKEHTASVSDPKIPK